MDHTDIIQYEPQPLSQAIEHALIHGDLSKLQPQERLEYYRGLCESLELNPLTRPFQFIRNPQGEFVLYAGKNFTEQLRKRHRISIRVLSRKTLDDGLYMIEVEGTTLDGRVEQSQGVVYLEHVAK